VSSTIGPTSNGPTTFALTGPAGTLVTEGIRTGYDNPDDAARALRDGTADLVVGALPFDLRRRAALLTPVRVHDALPPAGGDLPAVRIAEAVPALAEHRARVEAALRLLRDPENPLQKVVLARALRLVADEPMDPLCILGRLAAADPESTAYLADLSPAGFDGAVLVGASPELLVARVDDQVICQPFAGSAARLADPAADAAAGAALTTSAKNRHEHRLVVETMAEVLAPLCRQLDVAAEPQLSRTAALWHLRTPIRGTLREKSTTAMDLALALHPTPAVGGVPTALAVKTIAGIEGDRGFYAGAVGWCDGAGDGRWMVALRGAELSADRRSAMARAGGGVVAESDPDDEIAETTAKFRTVLTALGVP
jgi:isochorismate synthase